MPNGTNAPARVQYQASAWERVSAFLAAFLLLAVVSYLVIRNQPFADPNYALYVRILLSLATAIIGAVVPGFLHVDLKFRGMVIRAGGALAMFVVTYFFSPKVLPTVGQQDFPWARKIAELNGRFERLTVDFPSGMTGSDLNTASAYSEANLAQLQGDHSYATQMLDAQRMDRLPDPKQLVRYYYYRAMNHYQISAIASRRCTLARLLQRGPDVELRDIAIAQAQACADAAAEGIRWCNFIIGYPVEDTQQAVGAPRPWLPQEYRAVSAWVQEGIDKDLKWYLTAAHSALAFYDMFDLRTAGEEIKQLEKLYPVGSPDPPHKDELMRRIRERQRSAGEVATGARVLIQAASARLHPTIDTFKVADGEAITEPSSLVLDLRDGPKGPCCR